MLRTRSKLLHSLKFLWLLLVLKCYITVPELLGIGMNPSALGSTLSNKLNDTVHSNHQSHDTYNNSYRTYVLETATEYSDNGDLHIVHK